MPFSISFTWTGEWAWWGFQLVFVGWPVLGFGFLLLYEAALRYQGSEQDWLGLPLRGLDRYMDWARCSPAVEVVGKNFGGIAVTIFLLPVIYPFLFLAVPFVPLWLAMMFIWLIPQIVFDGPHLRRKVASSTPCG